MKKSILFVALFVVTACGTVFSGSNQSMTFESNVKDVKIYANGALVCSETPCRVDIDRASASLTIIAKADGYEDNIQQVKAKINPVSWGNLLSAYSWTTDFATGSMWKYSQDGIYINMKKTAQSKQAEAGFISDSKIRHFAVHNFAALQHEAVSKIQGEYMKSLSELTGKDAEELTAMIETSATEGALANVLTQ